MYSGLRRGLHQPFESAAVALAENENFAAISQRVEETEPGPFEVVPKSQKLKWVVGPRKAVKIYG